MSSVQVAALAIKPGPPPLTAVLRAHLAVKSDLVLALAVNIINLTPGTIVLEIDQARRMIYVHVLDVGSDRTVTRFYRQITGLEKLLVASFERDADWRPSARSRPKHGREARSEGGSRMTTVWVIAASMLAAAAVATMFRMLLGPTTLDRLVALDTLVAVTMCAIGTWAAFSLDSTVTYSLTALALISFVGSVSVARFRVPDVATPAAKDLSDERVRHRHQRADPRAARRWR